MKNSGFDAMATNLGVIRGITVEMPITDHVDGQNKRQSHCNNYHHHSLSS